MLSFQGKPANITNTILGKITFQKRNLLARHNRILVSETLGEKYWLYDGVISPQETINLDFIKVPCIYGVTPDNLSIVKEGDIVVLEPDGNVTIIWDVNSPHNALLATGDCNCSCIMCPQPRKKDREGLLDFNLKIIDLIDPERTNTLGITGGEPTLLGDGLIKLIEACKKRLPKTSLLLLTNGRRFSDIDYMRKIVYIGHPDLTFCIPLYADTDKEHDKIVGVKGSFYETVKGIDNLALFRQKVEIRNVIIALNYRRLPQFADFIYRNFPFALHVALMGMETIEEAKRNLNKIWIDPIEYVKELQQAVRYLNRRAINVSIYNLPLCILPQELWGYSRKSISLWKNIYLTMCESCDFRNECGGFFGTSEGWHNKHIHPLKKLDIIT